MANVFNKAERLVSTSLGLLERDTVAARLVWRDAAGDFAGAKNDTVSLRLPAYAKANKRSIRGSDSRSATELNERVVTVALDQNLYMRVPVTDAELTLDIQSFAEQVLVPMTNGLVRGIEDEIIAEIEGADYHENHVLELDEEDPLATITTARRLLNDARVPFDGRALLVGSAVEEALINVLTPVDETGSTGALREAQVGRLRGFNVFTVPGLDPDIAVAFHRTAFVLSSRAPVVPQGAPSGAVGSYGGFALRLVQAIDPEEVVDNVHADVYVGTDTVKDVGSFDANGHWEPAEDPDDQGAEEALVRAVKIALPSSS